MKKLGDMNVLVVANGIPTVDNPGLGIFEFDQAKALKKIGINVSFFAIDLRSIRRKRRWGFYKTEKDDISVYVLSLPIGNIPKGLFYRIPSGVLNRLLNHVIDQLGINILHTHFFEVGAIVSYVKLPEELLWIHTEHSSTVNKECIPEEIKKYGSFYHKVDRLISVSEALKENISRNFSVESVCIPNIIDLDIFGYINRAQKDKFTFVSTGNLVEIKRMDYLINTFAKVFRDDINVELLIIGDGPQKSYLSKLISENNCLGKIKLLGRKTRFEIGDIYKQCDCFVLLSESETFGVAYVEAMATGLPIIATKCGGPEGFCDDAVGYLIDKNDVDQLERVLLTVKNRDLFNYKYISDVTHDRFSSKTIANQILNVYEKESLSKC